MADCDSVAWEDLNPDRLKYQIVFADGKMTPHEQL